MDRNSYEETKRNKTLEVLSPEIEANNTQARIALTVGLLTAALGLYFCEPLSAQTLVNESQSSMIGAKATTTKSQTTDSKGVITTTYNTWYMNDPAGGTAPTLGITATANNDYNNVTAASTTITSISGVTANFSGVTYLAANVGSIYSAPDFWLAGGNLTTANTTATANTAGVSFRSGTQTVSNGYYIVGIDLTKRGDNAANPSTNTVGVASIDFWLGINYNSTTGASVFITAAPKTYPAVVGAVNQGPNLLYTGRATGNGSDASITGNTQYLGPNGWVGTTPNNFSISTINTQNSTSLVYVDQRNATNKFISFGALLSQINKALVNIFGSTSGIANLQWNTGDTARFLPLGVSTPNIDSAAGAKIAAGDMNAGTVNFIMTVPFGNNATAALTDAYVLNSDYTLTYSNTDGFNIGATPPLAYPQAVNVTEGSFAQITLTGYVSSGLPLSYRISSPPTSGVLSGSPPAVTYTPNALFHGNDSFTFITTANAVSSTAALVSLNVAAIDYPPVVTTSNGITSSNELTAIAIDPSVTVTDVDNTTLASSSISITANFNPGQDTLAFTSNNSTMGNVSGSYNTLSGALTLASSGSTATLNQWQNALRSVTYVDTSYTPNTANRTISFVANDGTYSSNAAKKIVSISAVNFPPTATPQSVTTFLGTPAIITLSGSDPAGKALTFSITTTTTNGTLSFTTPNATYTPNLNYLGADSFTFKAYNGTSYSANSATVSITVATDTASNVAPANTAPSGVQTIQENTTLSFTGASTLLVNDVNNNLSSTQITVVHGTVNVSTSGGATISAGANASTSFTLSGTQKQINAALATLTYTPKSYYSGSDTLTFKSTDSGGLITSSTVNINVTFVNHPPQNTVPSAQSVNENATLSFIAANLITVIDPDSNLATVQLVVSNGTLSVSTSGGATISAGANASSTLTLSGTQAQINLALATLTYTGNLNYSGGDTLTITSLDSGTPVLNAVSTVAITVTFVHYPPVATPQTVTTLENNPASVTLAGTDIAGYALSFAVASSPVHGIISGSAPNLTYTPNVNYSGNDSFNFTANDGSLTSNAAAVTLNVTFVAQPPVASPAMVTVNENNPKVITLTGTDPQSYPLTFTLATNPTHGSVSLSTPNATYTPNTNYLGADSFTFLAYDGTQYSALAATVSLSVIAVNHPPTVITPVSITTNQNAILSFTGGTAVTVNDQDSNLASTQLSVSHGILNLSLTSGVGVSAGAVGTATITLAGTQSQIQTSLQSLSYQGIINYSGSDILQVTATDSGSPPLFTTNNASIVITHVLQSPVITWSTPTPITYGTALTNTQLNAVSVISGNFIYTPNFGSTLNAGSQTLNTAFTPQDTANYTTNNSAYVILIVNKATETVNLTNTLQTYNGSSLPVSANAAYGTISVTYNGSATVPKAAGSYAVSATANNSNYTGTATATLTISQATPVITWATPSAITYGTTLNSSQLMASASFTGNTLNGSFIYTPNFGATLNAGVQTLNVSFTPVDTANFTSNYAAFALLTINKASELVVISNTTQTYTGNSESVTATANYGSIAVTYNGSATLPTLAGTYAVVATVSDSNYTGTLTTNFIINKASPVITWATPSAITYGTTLNSMQLNASSPVSGTFNYSPTSGATLSAGLHTLNEGFSPSDLSNYTTNNSVYVSLSVSKATPLITWSPAAMVYTSNLASAQLDATANYLGNVVAGNYVYTPALNYKYSAAGSYTLSLAFTPTDTGNFSTVNATTSLVVGTPGAANQTINFSPISDQTYGNPDITLNATASSGLPVSFIVSSGNARLSSSNIVTLTGAGMVYVTANQVGSVSYNAASPVTNAFNVAAASSIVTWATPSTITYGTALNSSQLNASASYSGNPLSGTWAYTPAAGSVLNAGTNTLNATFTPTDTVNYTRNSSVFVTLNVSKASEIVTLGGVNQTYNGNPESVTTTVSHGPVSVTYNGASSLPTAAGTYAVSANVTNPNYTGFTTGNLIIAQATPVIAWATPTAITYGAALDNTQLNATANLSGNTVNGSFVYTPATGTILNAGINTLSVSFAPSDTTNFTSNNAGTVNLVVNKATEVVTFSSTNQIYSGSAEVVSASVASGSISLTYNGSAGAPTAAGIYLVVASVSDPNFIADPANSAATLVIAKQSPILSWSKPNAISYGTTLNSEQLNADSNGVGGTFTYTPNTGTLLDAGYPSLSATFTPTDTLNYTTNTAATVLEISPAVVITANTHDPIYTGSPIYLPVTLLHGLTSVVTYYDPSGSGATVPYPLDPGLYPFTVAVAGDTAGDYATESGIFEISKATPVVSWATPNSVSYGSALSSIQLNAAAVGVAGSLAGTFNYSPSSGVVLSSGYNTLNVTFTPDNTIDYTSNNSAFVTLSVTKASEAISLSNTTQTYTGNSESVTATAANGSISVTYNGSSTLPTAAGSYAVVATVSDTNYSGTQSGVFTISQVTPRITWNTPADITSGTALSATQLNASAGDVAGTFVYSPTASTVLAIGTQTLSATFTPTDTTNYNQATAMVHLLVKDMAYSDQTITFNSIPNTIFGSAPITLTATASSGLAIAYSVESGPASVAGNQLTILGAGSVTVVANQSGDSGSKINAAPSISRSFNVSPETSIVTWATPSAITYGTVLGSPQLSASVEGDIAGTLTYSPSAGTLLAAGNQTLNVVFSPSDTANYTSNSNTFVSLTVNKATEAVSLSNTNQIYSGSAKEISASTANGSISVTYNGSPITPTAAGTYSVSATVVDPNYTGYTTGTLIINPLTPVINWANPEATTYGTPLNAMQLDADTAGLSGTFIYSPTFGATPSVGLQTLNVTFTPSDTKNYTSISKSVPLTITQATETITLSNTTQTFNGSAEAVSASTLSGVIAITYNGSSTAPTAAGSYAVVATVSDTNYSGTQSGVFTISQVTPRITWNTPADITSGTALSATQLNASAGDVAGTFVYSPTASTVLAIGTQTLSATFTPTDTTNYNQATAMVHLLVKDMAYSDQTITFNSIPNTIFGSAPITLTATASSGLAIAYSVESGPASVAGNQLTILGAGSVTVVANQSGDSGSKINAAPSISRSFNVSPETSIVTWATPSAITYGTVLGSPQLSASVEGDIAGTLTYSPSAGTLLAAGNQTLNVVFSPSDTANYTSNSNTFVSLTVNKATEAVSLSNTNQIYSGSAKEISASTANGSISVTYNGSPITPTAAGTYSVSATVVDPNYTGYTTGTLIINPLTPVINWANPEATTYGTPLNAMQLDADTAGLSGTFIYSPTFGATPSVGLQTLNVTFTPSDTKNYTSISKSVPLTITQATETITLSNTTQTFNGSAEAVSASTLSGVIAITYNGSSTAPTAAGTYVVNATAASTNYTGSTTGTLVINKATPVLSWSTPSSITSDSPLSESQLNATALGLDGVFTYTPPLGTLLPAGTQALSVSFTPLDTSNYTAATASTTLSVTTPSAPSAPPSVTSSAKISAGITISNTTQTYDGSAKVVTISLQPSQLSAAVVYYPGFNPPTEAGTYYVLVNVVDSLYYGSVSSVLTILPSSQTINFSAINTPTLGAPVTLLAKASSGLGVTFSILNGNATLVGNILTCLDLNPVTILATQAGDNDYLPTSKTQVLSASAVSNPPSTTQILPSFFTQPVSQTVAEGSSVTFSTSASGTPNPTYQWYFNGTAIAGATGPAFNISSAQITSAGLYTVVLTNSAGSVTSAPASLTVSVAHTAPVILNQPKSQTVLLGSAVLFTVTVQENLGVTYQWYFNGTAIAGATSAAYTITSASASQAGSYTVSVNNTDYSVASNVANLTVTVPSSAPSITQQPQSESVNLGSGATFTVTGSGTPNPTYQWYFNGTAITGATNASFAISTTQASNAGQYTVTLTNQVGSITSNPATLKIIQPAVNVSITQQPQTQTIFVSQAVTFSVSALGSAPLSYQWLFNGVPIPSATSSVYTLTNTQTSSAGSYSVVVTNPVSSVTSSNALLSVLLPFSAPVISLQPNSQIVQVGSQATFAVATSTSGTTSYQWYLNGAIIYGATASTYSILNCQASNAGSYMVVLSNAAGSTASLAAVLSVTNPAIAPVITLQPQSQTSVIGNTVTFTVLASGTPSPTYQWYNNWVPITSATSSSLTLNSVQFTDQGSYTVIATNPANSVTSAAAILTLQNASGSPFITTVSGVSMDSTHITSNTLSTTTSSTLAVPLGGSATLTATATGNPSPNFQWYFNGQSIAGANGPSYSISNFQSWSSGSYSVLATNALGSYASYGQLLIVAPTSGTPVITTQPHTQFVTPGETVTLSTQVGVNTQSSYTNYQWYLNGIAIAGATHPLLMTTASVGNSGSYQCMITNASGSILTNPALISVAPTSNPGRLINLSVLSYYGPGNQALSLGFVIGGYGTSGNQPLLIRAVGPSLKVFQVPSLLGDPSLSLFSGPFIINNNAGWANVIINQSQVSAADTATGAFALTNPSSLDAALVTTLPPSAYTIQVGSTSGNSGNTLAEIYDDTPTAAYLPSSSRLVNLSCGQLIQSGSKITAGFVIGGNTSKTVLVRVVGPTLANYAITGYMPDPQLKVFSGTAIIGSNSGWAGDTSIIKAAASAGAFPLNDPKSNDSAILLTLAPGSYSVEGSSVSGTVGVALIEVYDIQ